MILLEPAVAHHHILALRIGNGSHEGLCQGLSDVGLDDTALEFNEALRIALDDDLAEERWLAGEDIFVTATLVP